ncbi:MAG: type II toxin-antitoxin system ParD family antitoxin [Albidovulum sp.]
MAKTTSIVLGATLQEFARRKVDSGEFGSTSEVVREAMRRYIAEDMKLETLRAAIKEGVESGPSEPFDFDTFIAERKASPRGRDAA